MSAKASLFKTASLIAAVTLLSKLTGAVRDWQIMHLYGASQATDAYFAAFQIPAFSLILLGGLGGPFHTTTVSMVHQWEAEFGPEGARQRMGAFFLATLALFALLSVLTAVFAKPIMAAMLGADGSALLALSSRHLRIMAPVVGIGGVIGVLYAWSNLHQRFFWPSFAPALVNLALIVGLWVFPLDAGGDILAWSTLIGAALQLAAQLPDTLKARMPFTGPLATLRDPASAKLWTLLLPAAIGTTIGQLITYVDLFFAARLPVGSWSALTLANRLIQLPIGVLQTALLVPLFPRLTEARHQERYDEMLALIRQGVVALWILCLPVLVIMAFDALPLIRFVFEQGAFTPQASITVAAALTCQALSMIPYFARDTFTRVAYAFHNARLPLLVGCFAILTKAGLNALLTLPALGLGASGIALSTSLITLMNMTLLGVWIRRLHLPQFRWGLLLKPFSLCLLPTLAMAGWFWLAHDGLGWLHAPTLHLRGVPLMEAAANWGRLIAVIAVGLALYAAALLKTNLPEVQWVTARLLGRFRRQAPPASPVSD